MILILEDNHDRLQRFSAVLRAVDPALEVRFWRSAKQMVQEVRSYLPSARLISLDHDLDRWEGDADDPGDGFQVAKFLATEPQPCPIIIHSSNRERSDWMAGELALEGWKYHRVMPIGEDWIEEHWGRIARRLLRKSPSPIH